MDEPKKEFSKVYLHLKRPKTEGQKTSIEKKQRMFEEELLRKEKSSGCEAIKNFLEKSKQTKLGD